MIDDDVVNGRRIHDRDGAQGPSGVRVVFLVEADLVGGPFQPRGVGTWLCCRDFTRQLLEVAIRHGCLGSS
jgi:hypothetical protein